MFIKEVKSHLEKKNIGCQTYLAEDEVKEQSRKENSMINGQKIYHP